MLGIKYKQHLKNLTTVQVKTLLAKKYIDKY